MARCARIDIQDLPQLRKGAFNSQSYFYLESHILVLQWNITPLSLASAFDFAGRTDVVSGLCLVVPMFPLLGEPWRIRYGHTEADKTSSIQMTFQERTR
jgi:hypothetical protein